MAKEHTFIIRNRQTKESQETSKSISFKPIRLPLQKSKTISFTFMALHKSVLSRKIKAGIAKYCLIQTNFVYLHKIHDASGKSFFGTAKEFGS